MKCNRCPFYSSTYISTECTLLEIENFIASETDCKLVNEDGTINDEELAKIEQEE